MKTSVLFMVTLVLAVSFTEAQIQTQSIMLTTKHNLGVSGTGSIKASTEQQLCVFCHTPHVPRQYASTQLWNHQMSTQEYTLYSSDYLTSLTYDAPNQPNSRSKLCLSCHDGTVAIGAVYNNQGVTNIAMMNNVTTIPQGSAGNLGTSLTDDHPIGFVYNAIKDPELVSRQWPWKTPVALDPDAPNGTVECITCHDPHDDTYGKFLRVNNANAALCTFCHVKTGWTDAVHRTSQQSYTPPGSQTATLLGEWSCRSCHVSHNGQGIPYLLRYVEENTCYDAGCHGSALTGINTKNIQSVYDKLYRHPTNTVTGKHRNPDTPASLDAANRHAECPDCHNSHQATKGLHTVATNTVSGVLLGVNGVIPGPAPGWTQPPNYTDAKPSVQENQICFKCHSSYAFGIVPDGVTTILGPSGVNSTDQAMEFNPANRSAHPVRVALSVQTGSVIPQALTAQQMTADWSAAGTQTMYCSDCHGNDESTSPTVPQGPHASNAKYMLTGRGKYWPTNAFGTLWSLDDIKNNKNNWQNDLFCANCHPMFSGISFLNNVHDAVIHQDPSIKCVTCHVAVPHGAKRSRLIGYATDVSPYNYNGTGVYDKLVVTGFAKAAGPTLYQTNNCSMNGVCHGTQSNFYEP